MFLPPFPSSHHLRAARRCGRRRAAAIGDAIVQSAQYSTSTVRGAVLFRPSAKSTRANKLPIARFSTINAENTYYVKHG
eukprot:3645040-Pleurochrysis_carterae.AAC.1